MNSSLLDSTIEHGVRIYESDPTYLRSLIASAIASRCTHFQLQGNALSNHADVVQRIQEAVGGFFEWSARISAGSPFDGVLQSAQVSALVESIHETAPSPAYVTISADSIEPLIVDRGKMGLVDFLSEIKGIFEAKRCFVCIENGAECGQLGSSQDLTEVIQRVNSYWCMAFWDANSPTERDTETPRDVLEFLRTRVRGVSYSVRRDPHLVILQTLLRDLFHVAYRQRPIIISDPHLADVDLALRQFSILVEAQDLRFL